MTPRWFAKALVIPLLALGHASAAETGNAWLVVRASVDGGVLREEYFGLSGSGRTQVAAAAEDSGLARMEPADGAVPHASGASVGGDGDGNIVETWRIGDGRITRTLAPDTDGPWVKVTTRLEGRTGSSLRSFTDGFRFLLSPDRSYAPSVGGFVPDGEYKPPLILVQSGRAAFGIVPDVLALNRNALATCSHSLDLDVPGGPILTVGFVPARMAYHSVYQPDPSRTWSAPDRLENAYYLLVTAGAAPGEAYREATRMLWRKFGRKGQRDAAAQQIGTATPVSAYWWLKTKGPIDATVAMDKELVGLGPWEDWRKEVWERQSRNRWMTFPIPGGLTGGGVPTLRWGAGPSLYLTAWFNTLRTSFGMALYARRSGDAELLRMAGQTLEAALHAPGRDGAFKCIGLPGAGGVSWAAGDGGGDSTVEGYLGYDMSWTGYWLLRWREAGLPGGGDILPRCQALARFLCNRQEADGMLPTRFAEDGTVDRNLSRTVKAETGPVALFLLELHSQDHDRRWLEAAERGLAFLDLDVVPRRQWYDFETFWSCSPRRPALDARTGEWPSNDLALGQATEAYLAAYRATEDKGYLARGESVLDFLLLSQQCWTNPVLEGLDGPQTLLGGFTTQNSDAEWSDARQSQCGNIILDYYRATGNPEYLERGVAALRAQFPVSPCENWAHTGYGTKTGISSFHWGTGSGMAGIEIDEDFLRDAAVDVASGRAVGVNGINVTGCRVLGGEISLEYSSPFAWSRNPVFTFHGCGGRSYRVIANGAYAGTWDAAVLEKGVGLPVAGAAQGFPADMNLQRVERAAPALVLILLGGVGYCYLYTLLLSGRWLWSACRLAPTIGLFHGYPLYSALDHGPINGWLHGPVAPLLWSPAALAGSPAVALAIAGGINLAFLLCPLAVLSARAAGGTGAPRLLGFAFGAAAILTVYPTWYMASVLCSDAVAAGLGLASCLVLLAAEPARTRSFVLAAILAALASWTKQTEVVLVAAQAAWLLLDSGWRAAARYALCCAVVLCLSAGIVLGAMNPHAVILNMWTIPTSQKLVGSWGGAWGELREFLGYTLLFTVPCAAGLGLFKLGYTGGGALKRARTVLLLLFAAAALLPPGIAATLKMGGDRNSLHSVYFLAAGAIAALSGCWSAEGRLRAVVRVASVAAAVLAVVEAVKQVHYYPRMSMLPPRCVAQDDWALARSSHERIYFPEDPLAGVMAEGRMYHFDYAVLDREYAGITTSEEHIREAVPADAVVIVYPRTQDSQTIVRKYLREFVFAGSTPESIFFRRSAKTR